ncbi:MULTISPECIES: Imm41 family immunity protein [unclassified Pseudomonas]|uniref:Imm41 family immunity protein n=1 Tax=unclassified Pseudomonas TaxID=196821 RepID=UPI000A1DE553|nr:MULTISPECIES: Imm41 family immunity protein [unclassified Pseudomonas]
MIELSVNELCENNMKKHRTERLEMDPHFLIARNVPWCDEYDYLSFTGRMHGRRKWSRKEYWKLEWALYQLVDEEDFSQELYWRAFKIFSITQNSFTSHYDSRDLYKIRNLKRSELYEIRQRFRSVFEGFFSGQMPSLKYYDEQNPLLIDQGD